MTSSNSYDWLRARAKELFEKNPKIRSPYFGADVILNADGLHHLRYSSRHERSKKEQMRKLYLVPLALGVIRDSGTVQEYRKLWQAIGKPSARDGLRPAKQVEYWGFVAIVGPRPTKIRVVLRRVGDGNIVFWSVMPFAKTIPGIAPQLAPGGLEDE